MKQILYVFWVACAFWGCSSDKEETPVGGIAGSVSDKTTGDPVATVSVKLSTGESTVTGSDGTFSFTSLTPGTYSVDITKEGYKPNRTSVSVKAGEQAATHLLIERIPAVVTTDTTIINFGSDASLNTLSFKIVNSSYEDLVWEVEHNCSWIQEVKPQGGILRTGKTETIRIDIDRDLLDAGDNKTILVVRSSNGSSQVIAKAVAERELPVCQILEATNITSSSAILNGKILNSGTPAYTERGFVYGTTRNPTVKNTKVLVEGSGTGAFSVAISELSLNQTYYVRAYAVNKEGVSYSSEIEMSIKPILPEVSILDPTNINILTGAATLNGHITRAGDPAYMERGFVYSSTVKYPTVQNTKVVVPGSGEEAFYVNISELPLESNIYVRAYVTHSTGVVYSSRVLVISTQSIAPLVETLKPTDVGSLSRTVTLCGNVSRAGTPAYSERGFVFSTVRDPTINDNKIVVDGSGTVTSFNVSTDKLLPEARRYYVRAYAKNRGWISYGDNVYVDFPWIEFSSLKIAVQTESIGTGNWEEVNTMCKNSRIGGYSDWRLPTKDELMQIHILRDKIGIFDDRYYYWSSSVASASTYYTIYLSSGSIVPQKTNDSYRARCVRTLK